MTQLVWETEDDYIGIDDFIQKMRIKKILLVHGSHYEDYKIASYFRNREQAGIIKVVDFSDYTPNPKYEDVVKGVGIYNRCKCEGIVAVGGGSTIDVAKCIKLFANLNENVNFLHQKPRSNNIPLIAIPTTAGSGSEATKHAVIYYAGEKQSISHKSILPNGVVLDASTLEGLPLYQKKCTLLDALCQAIESWWSVHSTEESIGYSREAILLIMGNWKSYIMDNDRSAARSIMKASYLSGCAINITATTAAHAMSYKLTSMYGLPHGHAVAICMREVWSSMMLNECKINDPRGEQFLKNKLRDIEALIGYGSFCDLLEELFINKPKSKQRLIDIGILVQAVNVKRLSNNPVWFEKNVLEQMYDRIVGE